MAPSSNAISKKYVKLDQKDHVLARPGMYIGSIEKDVYDVWVPDGKVMVKKKVKYIPGLPKIFDEILVNAIDHSIRLIGKKPEEVGHYMKNLKVNLHRDTGVIEVTNDGDGIDVVMHPEHKIYIPELIFGNLLTSTNYDDSEEKTIGGQNGLGSKCLSLDTVVPLYDGRLKLARDITVGDILIGDDGNKRVVLNTLSGVGKMYEVSQVYGDSYKVNEDHILTMHMPDHKVIFWNTIGWSLLWWDNDGQCIKKKVIKSLDVEDNCEECGFVPHSNKRVHPDSEVTSTRPKDKDAAFKELEEFSKSIPDNNVFDISIKDYLNLSKNTQSRLAGVRGKCVNWDNVSVALDPYVLGLWLGDGVPEHVCDEGNDPEIISYLGEWGKNNDAPLKKLLEKYNLIKNKHIPKEYLINSRDVRLKVLAGIIDTVGTVSRDGTRVVITQGEVQEQLISDILYLTRSLGFCARIRKFNTTAYNINISGDIDDIPTVLPMRKCTSNNTQKTTGQIKIKEIDDTDYIGIKIDGNERFLINDFTVTHNCTNVFSSFFEVETIDAVRKSLYIQRFENNMSVVNPPVITKSTKKPYTTIRFKPDYKRFNIEVGDEVYNDMFDVMTKRVYDAGAVTNNDITVWLNDEKLDFKTFEKYVDMYLGSKSDHVRVYESINDRWEVVASYNNFNGFEQISFVNGIWTIRGGKHVDYIANQITKKLIDLIQKRRKDVIIKPQTVKDNLILFVRATIVNPTFDSQSKETLTTPATKFGSKAEISDKFIDKLYKSGIVEKLLEISNIQGNNEMKKTDGKKKTMIRGLTKLEDANWAGTAKSKECTLVLTEGDSAASMAIAGLSEVGRDKYGVFPLKGKLMNVKDQVLKRIADNDEITNLKKILGLESGKEYKSLDDLRYGRIMVLADQDTDGSHIKGLLFNMFHSMWPSLVKCNTFMTSMLTPIIKTKKSGVVNQFYNMTEYNNWLQENNNGKGWEIKYYKGLGTSTSQEAIQYFKELKKINYNYTSPVSDERLDLAFNKKRADDRKSWLGNYDRQNILDCNDSQVSYEDFIDKELIHFSNYDVERSIPNLCDGLKVSQRKILFACFKKNLVKEIKVAQLSGYVSENAAYHHGEASLQGAIVGMAQNFVGSNNINLLKPNGQFGTRRCGGKDAASPRYIYTLLSQLTSTLFRKEDSHILTYLKDDGMNVEPEYYMPIIPMVLVNGAIGIGTGFSTNIPCFNPTEIVNVLRQMLKGDEDVDVDLRPWYNGFKGAIEPVGVNKYVSRGTYKKMSATKIDITELPVGFWTQDFKDHVEEYMDKNQNIKSYESHYTETDIRFTLNFTSSAVCEEYLAVDSNGYTKLENDFKLVSSKNLSTSNMYLFNSKCQIQKYDRPIDIIRDFYVVRLRYYQTRKDNLLAKLEFDIDLLKNKIRFIKSCVEEVIKVHKMKKVDLVAHLEGDKYTLHDDSYDYILRIPIYNLTIDKVDELEAEMKKAQEEIDRVRGLDVKEWWSADLDAFVEEYKKIPVTSSNPAVVKKQVLKKK